MIKYAGFLSIKSVQMASFLVEQEATHLQAQSLGMTAEQVEAVETELQRLAVASLYSNYDYWRIGWDDVLRRLKGGEPAADIARQPRKPGAEE